MSLWRVIGSLVLASAITSACATAPAPKPRTPPKVVKKKPTRGIALHGTIGTRIQTDVFVQALRRVRHVYVGERHREPLSQETQLNILQLLKASGAKLAIGIEWLPYTSQSALDRYLAGKIDTTGMLKESGWVKSWGHSFSAYRAIIQFAKRHKIPIWGLNAPKLLVKRVARGGLAALTEAERRALPPRA